MRPIEGFSQFPRLRSKVSPMSHMPSDIDIMLLHDEAGTPAFAEAVVRIHYDYIHRLCLSILRHDADASDAAQEAFIAALAGIHRYRPGTNFRAWLCSIAVHKCYGILRKHKAQQRLIDALRFALMNSPRSPNSTGHDPPGERRTELHLAIQELSPKHQVAVILRYVHGMSIKDMAAVLGIREGTVHSRLHYAIRNLRRHIRQ
jgi:RNA polymerase sigma-70 factor (ECF subfamily)